MDSATRENIINFGIVVSALVFVFLLYVFTGTPDEPDLFLSGDNTSLGVYDHAPPHKLEEFIEGELTVYEPAEDSILYSKKCIRRRDSVYCDVFIFGCADNITQTRVFTITFGNTTYPVELSVECNDEQY